MSATRIVGIFLVRDEDLYVEQAIRNVCGFCDELILVDNRSHDRTPEILTRLADELPVPVQLHFADHPALSHELILPFVGEDAWVFGVDGDELYDPAGLETFKPRLVAGEFDDAFQIRGNVLHCTSFDRDAGRAEGYLAPPSQSMTKLYNFRHLVSWDGYHAERLHGSNGLVFEPPYEYRRYPLHEQYDWADSPFRCLHLCFVRRSSRETRVAEAGRESPTDMYAPPRRLPVRVFRRVRSAVGLAPASAWKREHYRRGEPTSVETAPFVREAVDVR